MTFKSILALLLIFQVFAFLPPAQADVKVQLGIKNGHYQASAQGTGPNKDKCLAVFGKNLHELYNQKTVAPFTPAFIGLGLAVLIPTLAHYTGYSPDVMKISIFTAGTVLGVGLKAADERLSKNTELRKSFEREALVSFSDKNKFIFYLLNLAKQLNIKDFSAEQAEEIYDKLTMEPLFEPKNQKREPLLELKDSLDYEETSYKE